MNINSNNNLHNDIRIKVANQIFTIKFNSPAYPIVFNLLTQQSSYHNNFFEIEDSSIEQRHFELYINLRMKGADCINSSKDIIDVCKLGKMFKEKIDIKELMNVVIAKQSNDINEEVDMMKHIDDTKDEEINEVCEICFRSDYHLLGRLLRLDSIRGRNFPVAFTGEHSGKPKNSDGSHSGIGAYRTAGFY